MTQPDEPDPRSPYAREPQPRWPGVLGAVGMLLGALIFIDKLDDLVMYLTWTEEDWAALLGVELTEFVMEAMPPVGWQIFIAVAEMGFGVLLALGSYRLWGHRRSGISLCRVWAKLAIAWAIIIVAWVTWWLQQYAGEIPGIPLVGWQGAAIYGLVFALAIMLAYPVFLLFWFSKPEILAEYEAWAD